MLASLLAGYTNGEIVGSLALACLFALLGYRMSHRHRIVRGVTPWRVPSVVWAAICFVLQPFGIIVELVAQVTTKTGAPASVAPAPPLLAIGPLPSVDAPSRTDAPPVAPVGPPPPATDDPGGTPLFGWYPDATGRHEQRYWDGRGWSEHVRDAGALGTDPL
ncbi:MAG: DUF2510 domain-containing protein [Actinomycetota bacterium]|nr:DUF2510 domain-containing protein [Actinomycetota bacterium]